MFLGIYPAVELLDNIVTLLFSFLNFRYHFPQWLYQFTFLLTVCKFPFLHILANISYLCSFLMIASLTHMRRYLIVALICISLKIHDVEHLCMYLQQLLF